MKFTESRAGQSAALAVLAVVLAATGFAKSAEAHQGHEHKVLGMVEAISADSVTVVDSKGEKHSGAIIEGTTVVERPAGQVPANDIVVGERCALVLRMDGEKMVALKVQLGAKPAVKP